MNVGVAWECAVPLSESWRSIEKLMSATKQDVLTLRCKVAVCGEAESGKTALTQMFVSKATVFPKNYKMVLSSLQKLKERFTITSRSECIRIV